MGIEASAGTHAMTPPLQVCADCGGEWFMVHNCPGALRGIRPQPSSKIAVMRRLLEIQRARIAELEAEVKELEGRLAGAA